MYLYSYIQTVKAIMRYPVKSSAISKLMKLIKVPFVQFLSTILYSFIFILYSLLCVIFLLYEHRPDMGCETGPS